MQITDDQFRYAFTSQMRHRLIRWVTVVALGIFATPNSNAVEDPVTLRQDRLFINQLLRRHFFGLARHHCVQQQAAAITVDSKANWQLRLSEIYEQQAWFSVTANRNGLLKHAADQITNFLEADRPSVEYEFLLRIQQVRLLSQAVRMELIVAEGGHLFGRAVRDTPATDSQLPANKVRIATLDNSITLIDALLRQLDQLRRDMDSQLVRRIGESARLERAELLVLKFKLTSDKALAATLFETASSAVEGVSRSRDADRDVRGQLLAAELALIIGDRKTFRLRVRSVSMEQSKAGLHPSFLTARSMLFNQEATDALRLLDSVNVKTTLQQQHLEWLKLECYLGIRELAGELQKNELVARASAEFETQLMAAGKVLKGVFRNAAERTSDRFNLVNVVGVQVADLVEQVEIQKALNRSEVALGLIEKALRQLPPDANQAIAALKLRAGEIYIASKNWEDATDSLATATSLFGQLQMQNEQSAADLMRIYVLSQQLDSTNATATEGYVAELEKHVAEYSEQSSCQVAMRWLFDVVQTTDSVRAADLALRLFRQESGPQRKMIALRRLGGLLLRQDASPGTSDLVDEFVAEFETLAADDVLYPAIDLVELRLQVLEIRLAGSSSQGEPLEPYVSVLAQLRRDLSKAVHLSDASRSELTRRCDLLDVVLTARTVTPADAIRAVESRLSQTPDVRLTETIQFLYRQQLHDTVQVGDVWLAKMTERLLRRLMSDLQPANEAETLITMLPEVRGSNRLTNDDRLLDEWIGKLLSHQLSGTNTIRVAEALSGGMTGTNIQQKLTEFWAKIASSNKQGSDLWLESQLRLAKLSIQSKRPDSAKRRIKVVSTLYPNWGSPERKQEVDVFVNGQLVP